MIAVFVFSSLVLANRAFLATAVSAATPAACPAEEASCQLRASDERGSNAKTSSGGTLVKVRLFWVRHGLSCANVMDKCSKDQTHAAELLPSVQRALQMVPGFESATIDEAFGLQPATPSEGDCTVQVIAPGLVPGKAGPGGAIIRVHDLYTDPALTDCSRMQSIQAGRSFMKWLQSKGMKLDFVGSSFLMRAFETAHGMFREPCSNTEELQCASIFGGDRPLLTPVPYMTERAPPGLTSFQQDNIPRTFDQQLEMIEKAYGKPLEVNSIFARSWPRFAQQYEKFKAFLAAILMPSISSGLFAWGAPSKDVFEWALDSALPEEMHPEDHGKEPIKVTWEGGQYATGEEFDKEEYNTIEAPELNIAVVGHNQMMSEYCLAPDYKPKPNNNAVLEKLFILEYGPTSVTMRELRGKCSLVMDAPPKSSAWSNLTTADVTGCSTPFVVQDFLDLEGGVALESTRCVGLAEESEAFRIQPEFS